MVVAIIAILAAMLLPTLGKAKEGANGIASLSNLGEISKASILYADDNAGRLMPHYSVPGRPFMPGDCVRDPNTCIVQNGGGFFWKDQRRIRGYAASTEIFDYPSLRTAAAKSIGNGISVKYALGIGMNYPALGIPARATQEDGLIVIGEMWARSSPPRSRRRDRVQKKRARRCHRARQKMTRTNYCTSLRAISLSSCATRSMSVPPHEPRA